MKIILVGKSNSGKTYFSNILKEYGDYTEAIFDTTRPMRPDEINGESYNFVTEDEFTKNIHENKYIYFNNFNNWFYGITYEEYELSDIVILTPSSLLKIRRDNVFVIYIDTTKSIKHQRLQVRNKINEQESHRRFESDEILFDQFEREEQWDLKITTNNINGVEMLLNLIKNK